MQEVLNYKICPSFCYQVYVVHTFIEKKLSAAATRLVPTFAENVKLSIPDIHSRLIVSFHKMLCLTSLIQI